jgi:hypothetical protein
MTKIAPTIFRAARRSLFLVSATAKIFATPWAPKIFREVYLLSVPVLVPRFENRRRNFFYPPHSR